LQKVSSKITNRLLKNLQNTVRRVHPEQLQSQYHISPEIIHVAQ